MHVVLNQFCCSLRTSRSCFKKMRPGHCTKKSIPGVLRWPFWGPIHHLPKATLPCWKNTWRHPTHFLREKPWGRGWTYKHCNFTGTVLWYYHRAWVTCAFTWELVSYWLIAKSEKRNNSQACSRHGPFSDLRPATQKFASLIEVWLF